LHLVCPLMIALLAGCAGSATPTPPPLPAEVVGTWTGTVIEPEGRYAKNWLTTLSISPCVGGEKCGTLEMWGKQIVEPGGADLGCTFALKYTGIDEGAFVFEERLTGSTWNPGCFSPADGYVTPMADGTLDFREFWESRRYTDHGTLHRVDGS
jgi:hypothetical protein